MHCWCSEFRRMRVFSCESTKELPDNIGHWKHLRYLKISRDCPFKSLPSAFFCLYNLQILRATKCELESLPNDFFKLLNLRVLELPGELCFDAANEQGPRIRLLKSVNQICGGLSMYNLHVISKDHAAEVKLKNMKYLDRLKMEWSSYLCPKSNPERNEKEVLQVLQPPTSLKSLELLWYPCELPSWFRPRYLPNITSLAFRDCHGIESISFSDIDLNEIPGVLVDNNDGSIGNFSSLADLSFCRCQNLSSLEQFLQHVPAVKRIKIHDCGRLVALPTARFADLHCLEELEVIDCPFISSQSLLSPSLKRLFVREGLCNADTYQPPTNILDNIDCSSLTSLYLSCSRLTSIQLQMWTLPALQELKIERCRSLSFIGESESVFTNLPRHGGSSSIKTFSSLPGERFGSFPFLKDLEIRDCPNLDWRSGLVLPSSLRSLSLARCGDISAWFPSCLESLTSLVSLKMFSCAGVASIPRHLWRSNLALLQELCLWYCPDLVSIGGAEAIAKIKNVNIWGCPKLEATKADYERMR